MQPLGRAPSPESGKNIVIRAYKSLLICCQSENTTTDAEFNQSWEIINSSFYDVTKIKMLVVTKGGGPTPGQRKIMEHTLAGKSLRTAVVSDSMKLRFIISTMSLFNSDLNMFTSKETDNAYDFLGLTGDDRTKVASMVEEMNRQLV